MLTLGVKAHGGAKIGQDHQHLIWSRDAGHPKSALYAASKAAVNAFSQSLADEVKEHSILVNVISPGPIRTQMTADYDHQLDRPRPAHLLEPDDVANAALYLASDLSGRVNAQIIHIRESNRW